MPNQDNVQMEKISLGSGDFAEDLGNNSFGIEDTQLLGGKELQNFLLSDPDEIKKIEDEKKEEALKAEKAKQQQQQQSQQQDSDKSDEDKKKEAAKTNAQKEEERRQAATKSLENVLFNEGVDENQENEEGKQQQGQQNPGDNKSGIEDDTYTTLGKDLLRLGVFTKNSDEETEENLSIKTPEDFLDRFSLEKKKGAINILDNFLSQFGEDYRKMFDAVFVSGVKPQEYLQSFEKIEAMNNLDLTKEDTQMRVMRAYYKTLKMNDDKIEEKLQKLKDYGELEDEAKIYHEVLLNKEKDAAAAIEKAKQDEQLKTKEKDQALAKSYQRILTEKLKAQEFDGIPLTQKEVQETFAYLTNKPYKLASGEYLTEFDKDIMELNRPENHELKIKLGLLLRKKLDLTTIKKTAVSKKSDALFTLSTKNAKQNPKEKETKSFF